MLRTTNESYQQMNGILTQIGDALVIPTNQPENRHIIQEILMQERHLFALPHLLGLSLFLK